MHILSDGGASMLQKSLHNSTLRLVTGCFGALLFAIGLNVLVTPLGLYSAGLLGYAQLIRTLIEMATGLEFQVDIATIIYYVMNIPIFYLGYHQVGKRFVWSTVLYLSFYSVVALLIPVPKQPILDDTITCAILGGLICGLGFGLTLTCGGSLGGMDILGVAISKKIQGFTVGRFYMILNAILYTVCLFLFDLPTVIYSLIYAAVYSLAMDRFHQQSINMQALIMTRADDPQAPHRLAEKLGRGVTSWEGLGGYSGEPMHVFCICTSKYELEDLRRSVAEIDPHAFVTVQEGVHIYGNYAKRLN